MSMVIKFPRRDASLVTFLANFNSILTASGVSYGVPIATVTSFNTSFTGFQAAVVACDPTIRSQPAVVTKDELKKSIKAAAFTIAMAIAGNAAVTNSEKLAMGITPRAMPSVIPPPPMQPVTEVIEAFNRSLRCRFHDGGTGSRRGLPSGVSGINVFTHLGASPPENIEEWTFEGGSGKNVVLLEFDSELPAGTKVWITAFFFNGRKQSGPIANPISAILPGGGVAMGE